MEGFLQRHGCSLALIFILQLPLLASAQEYKLETVYFATDRDTLLGDGSKDNVSAFDIGNLEGLKYGMVNVGIPLPTNNQSNQTLREATPDNDVVIYSMHNMGNNYTQFIQTINSKFVSSNENGSSATSLDMYIFIHGFAVTFEYAIKKVAQLKFDLDFLGPAIAYSWSSQGSITSYADDEVFVEKTIPYCKSFIKLCITQVEGERVHIMAHSMGTRALIGSLESMYMESDVGEVIHKGKMQLKSLIFAAADENLERFEGMFARLKEVHEEEKGGRRPHLTIYCATDDKALLLSSAIHDRPRLGLTSTHFDMKATTIHENPTTGYLDLIDATNLDAHDGGLHHLYYGNNPLCLLDIHTLLSSSRPPLDRAYYRALDQLHGPTISNVTFAHTYHFFSFSPSFWNNASL